MVLHCDDMEFIKDYLITLHITTTYNFIDSLQPFTEDITNSIDVSTILPSLISRGLLTSDQQSYFVESTSMVPEKKRRLATIIVNLSEDCVETFLQCLESTSDYLPHNSLLKKIRDGKCINVGKYSRLGLLYTWETVHIS